MSLEIFFFVYLILNLITFSSINHNVQTMMHPNIVASTYQHKWEQKVFLLPSSSVYFLRMSTNVWLVEMAHIKLIISKKQKIKYDFLLGLWILLIMLVMPTCYPSCCLVLELCFSHKFCIWCFIHLSISLCSFCKLGKFCYFFSMYSITVLSIKVRRLHVYLMLLVYL